MSAKVTMKSTKEEIFNALQSAEKALKSQSAVISTPEAAANAAKSKKIVEDAAKDVESGIFSPEMNAKFQNLQAAIAQEEAHLETCYGVKAALVEMTIAINAKKQAMMTLDAEMEQLRAAAEETKADLRAENKRLENELKQARDRENDEYQYNLERARKMEADEHADRMAELAKEKSAVQAELLKLRQDVGEIQSMQSRMEAIDEQLTDAYNRGVDDGKAEAGKEYGYKRAMADKDHDYEIRVRDSEITRLKDEVTEKTEKIATLETKLDAAYTQLRELATKTVESSGGLKVISTGSDSGTGRK